MKSTGVVRPIDPLGRVTLPKELRQTLNIGTGDVLAVLVDGNKVILEKYVVGCEWCNKISEDMELVEGKKICKSCADKITAKFRR